VFGGHWRIVFTLEGTGWMFITIMLELKISHDGSGSRGRSTM
ncbi:11875_t:CDS:1, partial [Gigaspora rosea]